MSWTKIKPQRIETNNSPLIGQVPKYVSDDKFERGFSWGGWWEWMLSNMDFPLWESVAQWNSVFVEPMPIGLWVSISDWPFVTLESTSWTSQILWIVIVPYENITISQVEKHPSCTWTQLHIIWTGVTYSAPFIWNIATVSDLIILQKWESYTIGVDNWWASYTRYYHLGNTSYDWSYWYAWTQNITNVVSINSAPIDINYELLLSNSVATTRQSLRFIAQDWDLNDLNVYISKTWTPLDIGFRLETDDNWKPSGILYDTNSYWTILANSIWWYFTNIVLTWNGSFVVTEDMVALHLVLFQWTYWAETIDAVNYYNIWITDKNTTTRYNIWYDGGTWEWTYPYIITNWFTNPALWTYTPNTWWNIYVADSLLRRDTTISLQTTNPVSTNFYITWDTKYSSCSTSDSPYGLWRFEVDANNYFEMRMWNPASAVYIDITTTLVVWWVTVYTYLDHVYTWWGWVGSRYTCKLSKSWTTYKAYRWNSSTNTWIQNGVDQTHDFWTTDIYWKTSWYSTCTNDVEIRDVHYSNADFVERYPIATWTQLVYVWWANVVDRVLSKTCALYIEQIPTDMVRIACQNGVLWDYIYYDYSGISKQNVWLIEKSIYFIWDSNGTISTTPWTNFVIIGQSLTNNELNISERKYTEKNLADTQLYATVAWAGTAYSSPLYIMNNFVGIFKLNIAWNTDTWTWNLQASNDGLLYFDVSSDSFSTTWNWTRYHTSVFQKWLYYRTKVTITWWAWRYSTAWLISLSK